MLRALHAENNGSPSHWSRLRGWCRA